MTGSKFDTFSCPFCSERVSISIEFRGKVANCPSCAMGFEIPHIETSGVQPDRNVIPPPPPIRKSLTASRTTNILTPPGAASFVQVNLQDRQAPRSHAKVSNSLGISSMIVGILSMIVCWLPFAVFILSGLGLLLGVCQIMLTFGARKGSGSGFGIAGLAISTVGLTMGIMFYTALTGFVKSFEQPGATPLLGNSNSSKSGDKSTEFHHFKEILTLGDVQIRITKVQLGKVELKGFGNRESKSQDDLIAITLFVSNVNKNKKIDYRSWNSSFSSLLDIDATLVDNFGNRYRQIDFGFGAEVKNSTEEDSLYPGKSTTDVIVFELPIENAKFLNLTLSGKAVSQDGEYRFRIPLQDLQRRD